MLLEDVQTDHLDGWLSKGLTKLAKGVKKVVVKPIELQVKAIRKVAPVAAMVPGPWQGPAMVVATLDRVNEARKLADHEKKQLAAAQRELQQATVVDQGVVAPDDAKDQFVAWFRDWKPDVYARVAALRPELGLSGLGEVSMWDTLLSASKTLITNAVDKKVFDLQAKRAALNQPPAPTPVAVASAQQQTGISTNTLLLVGGVGLAGVIAVMLARK